MREVLLGQAYYLRFDAKLWRAQQPYAPLGTLYAASYLRTRGHSTALFDAMMAPSERDWARALDQARPHVAVIYEDSFNYLTKMCLLRMRQAAERMTAHARSRGIPVIVSGSDATDHPDLYLRAGAAAVVLGEGEVTLAEAVDAIEAGRPLTTVDGLACLDDEGALVRTAVRPFVKSLDALPYPAWDLVDVPRYRAVWRRHHGYHAMNIATTRGCPFHCNWCAKPIYGQRYAVRSAASVADEIAWLKRDFAPDQLTIVDDLFGLQPGWLDRFAHAVDQQHARLPFKCLMRADQVSADSVRALVASGCRMVWMGAEDDIGVSVSYPLPGTKFYHRVRAELGEKQNWFDSDDLAMMYRATFAPEFYRTLHHVVHHEFRADRLARHLRARAKRPSDLRVGDLRHLAAWAYNRVRLPLAARALSRQARETAHEPAPPRLVPVLTQVAAAVPTRQDDEAREFGGQPPLVET
jgi:radical SAM superfamily enzyme YgiQ (UPF0313 family)